MTSLQSDLGKADWIWDEESQTHLPVCSQIRERGDGRKCGNGPLTDLQVLTGDCGDDHQWSHQFSSGMSPAGRSAMYRLMTEMSEHPWHSPLRFGKYPLVGRAIVQRKELIYSRILRVRFSENIFGHSSARIWLGHLEIVLDPIRKRDWRKRTKAQK